MRRKLINALLIMILVAFAAPVIVKADVLWEPQYDFFGDNDIKKTIEQRTYIANSPKGFINIYKRPDSSQTTGTLTNGEAFYVYYKAEYRGKMWGMNTHEEYIILDDTYVKYDHISFKEEYGDRIKDLSYDSTFELKKGYVYMTYPGAEGYDLLPFDNPEAYPAASFTDESGKEWLYFNYVYGLRNFWICKDDPTNTAYEIREITVPKAYASVTPTPEEIRAVAKAENDVKLIGTKRGKTIVVACICTFIVVIMAAFLIARKLRSENKE